LVHLAFQVMVASAPSDCTGAGVLVGPLATTFSEARWLLRALALCAPLGFIALEAGWFLTELGRQPWTVYGLMRTSNAVTPVADVPSSFILFTALYFGLQSHLSFFCCVWRAERSYQLSGAERDAEVVRGS